MAISIRIDGIPGVVRFLSSKKKGIEKGITDGTLQGGELLREEVRASIQGQRAEPRSVDTGALLNSVNLSTTTTRDVQIFSDVEHAKFIEFGTFKIPARRHFQNSADRNKNRIIDKINTQIKTNL
jgi:hypothetical protein